MLHNSINIVIRSTERVANAKIRHRRHEVIGTAATFGKVTPTRENKSMHAAITLFIGLFCGNSKRACPRLAEPITDSKV